MSRRKPGPHPFAAGAEMLQAALGVDGGDAQPAEIVVRLPSAAGLPLSSGDPGGVENAQDQPIELAVWNVPSLTVHAAAAVELLLSLVGESSPPEVEHGDDLRFWASAARLALEILSRQEILPAIEKSGDGFVAAWRPDLSQATDRERLRTLHTSMPPACRALAWDAKSEETAAGALLDGFLTAAVDGLAREALAEGAERTRPQQPGRRAQKRTPADAWLQALGGEPELTGDRQQLARLLEQYQVWKGGADQGSQPADSFRVCFRLDPPADEQRASFDKLRMSGGDEQRGGEVAAERRWTLEYLLQASDDPSLIVPAAEVWRRRSPTAEFLNRRFDNPQERLLAALGRAARLFGPIEHSLQAARPEFCALSVAEAHQFVRESALLLQASGFGVLVPGLQTKVGVRLTLGSRSAAKQPTGPATLSWDSLVDYDWQLAIGDETLSREEFEALARLKEPLVQIRGQWVELRPEQVEQALALFRHQDGQDSDEQISLRDALRVALAADGELGLPVVKVETVGWIDELLHELREGAGHGAVEEPPGFVGRLRPYQKVGVSWLAALSRYGVGACLADDMGLGKTVQLIALILHQQDQQERDGGRKSGPTLLICPTSVAGNWRHELARFAPGLRVLVHHGTERNRDGFADEAGRYDLVISTYALLHRDEAELGAVEWANVVLDEAQNIKNPSTRAAQAARNLRTRWRVALTGTPIENRLSDLWSLFQFLDPGYLGSSDEFRKRFVTPIERAADGEATARLKALISPLILRRLKTDRSIIEDLPEKNEMKVFCTISREQATLYEAIVRDSVRMVEEAEGIQRRGLILAMIAKLKQVCDHPVLFLKDGSGLGGRSGKLARLTEMLEEVVSAGDRALIFTQFAEMGKLLKTFLEDSLGQEILFLHGGTPATERDRMVARFQGDGRTPQVFVLSIKAGGTGLNLTRANHVFHFDRWWNPAVENQATDRAFRIGQRRDVQVHKFICAGTFEETIDELIERKVALSQAIIGTNESWITEMSTEELRSLLALRAEAVGVD